MAVHEVDRPGDAGTVVGVGVGEPARDPDRPRDRALPADRAPLDRSEEHTSELQSHVNLVCRLLLEKKKQITYLGPAGLRVDGVDLRLQLDPWLSKTGAVQAGWPQVPAHDTLCQPGLVERAYGTVSHDMLDHWHLSDLASLAPTSPVLIPRSPSPNFRARLMAAGVANRIEVPACQNCLFFFFNDTATTEIYTLSLHDALPI